MSKIIKETGYRELSHIVECDGQYFFVDSVYTLDHAEETMVFEWDIGENDVVSWSELYCKRYSNYDEMKKGHYFICQNLETILEKNQNYESDITFGDFITVLINKAMER